MGVSWEEGLAGHQHSLIYPGAFSQPQTPLRLFPQRKFPDKPRHLLTWRASGTWELSELGGVYAWKGLLDAWKGLLDAWKGLLDAWKGLCKARGGAEVSIAHWARGLHSQGGVWSWKVGSHSWQGLSHTSKRDTLCGGHCTPGRGCCGLYKAGAGLAQLAEPEGCCKAGG